MASVVIIDDEASILDLMSKFCRSMGHEVHARQSGREGLEALTQIKPDLLLVDLHIGEDNGLEVIRQCRRASPKTAIIMVTGHSSIETAVEAMRLGAFDYLSKPFELTELKQTITHALEKQKTTPLSNNTTPITPNHSTPAAPQLIGNSPALQKITRLIQRVANSDSPVLLEGEFGVGKHLIAKVLHQSGNRKNAPYKAIQCSALSPELLEAELFGHYQPQGGIFERARGGTVHLAEIHLMPMSLQAQLHTMLDQPSSADHCRLIISTSQRLEDLIQSGKFREDLYYKISVIPFHVPALRERPEDIPLLIQHILNDLSRRTNVPMKQMEPFALEFLQKYSWPGNISELRNAVERACALSEDHSIKPTDLPAKITQKNTATPSSNTTQTTTEHSLPIGSTLDDFVRSQEKHFINETLKFNNGSREKTASMLGISIATLYRKMELNVARRTTT